MTGFQSWGDSSYAQIDSDFRNIQLVGKYVVTSTGNLNAQTSQGSLTIVSNGAPLCAVEVESGKPTPVMMAVTITGNSWKFDWIVKGSVGTQFTVYVFDLPTPPAGSGFGMQVFTPTGALAFDARYKPFSVIDEWDVTTGYLAGAFDGSWRNLAAGKKYAICQNAAAVRGRSISTGGQGTVTTTVRAAGFYLNGTNLRLEVYAIFNYQAQPNNDTIGTVGQYLLLDVTGF